MNRSTVGRDFASDQVEQRGLAGHVRADDQPPLARRDIEIDVIGDVQAAERLAEAREGERAHGLASVATTLPGKLFFRHISCHSRALPGTRPSGIIMTIATKIAPSRKFQRSMKPLTTVLTATTRAAPTIGPSRVPAPPEITISSTSAEDVSASVCGLMNCV